MSELMAYSLLLIFGVFVSSVSQAILKKEAISPHESVSNEYLNPRVMFAYVLFVSTTFLAIFAYKVVPLSMGAILESTSYLWITIFGLLIFKEKITKKKYLAMFLIITGIAIFSLM